MKRHLERTSRGSLAGPAGAQACGPAAIALVAVLAFGCGGASARTDGTESGPSPTVNGTDDPSLPLPALPDFEPPLATHGLDGVEISEPGGPVEFPLGGPGGEDGARANPSEECLNDLVVRAEREPSVAEAQGAALAWARVEPLDTRALRRRIGLSHLLPDTLRVDAERSSDGGTRNEYVVDQDFDALFAPDDSGTRLLERTDGATETSVGLTMEWDLSGLIWDADELDLASEAADAAEATTELLEAVAEAWFERRRAQIRSCREEPEGDGSALEARWAVDEATAVLDALTGGWFGAQLDGTE